MRRSRRRGGKKPLTLGRVLLIVIIGTVVGLTYVVSLYGFGSNVPGFPFNCAGSEGTAIHIHPYLQIAVNGQNVAVPAGVGIARSGTCFEPIHTHDTSGVIHMESPNTSTQYTLSEFFQIWNATYSTVTINGANHPIIFNSTDILGFRADGNHKVVLLVDGIPSSAYGSLVLNSLDYCSASTTGPPCSTAVGDPFYGGQQYPFGTGHTIVIEYTTTSG